jgi:hypothetical protein
LGGQEKQEEEEEMPQVVAVEQLQFIFDLIYYFLTPPISLLLLF